VFQLGTLPCENPARALFGDGRLYLGAPPFQGAFPRHTDRELLLQNDAIVRKIVGIPELAGNERFGATPMGVEFEHVAHTEAFYGDVLFSQIAVERGFAGNFRSHVLSVFGWGRYHRTVRFLHANVVDVHTLGRVLIRKRQQGVVLHARVRLDADSGRRLPSPDAIVFEDNSRGSLLDDKRLLGVIRLGVWL
jgi:hypothetical protein